VTDLHPDHLNILALARAALSARDNAAAWARSPEKAADHHGACCDAVWSELERQVNLADGKVPVLEHPSVKSRRLAKQLRSDIICATREAICETLDAITDGAFDWDPPT
jgi:hypothetical protein